MKDIKIKRKSIYWFFLSVFWIMENIAPHTIYSQVTMVLMVIFLSLYIIQYKFIKISPVMMSFFVLIILQLLFIVFGFVKNTNVTLENVQTMAICFICGILIYSFLSAEGKKDKVIEFFLYTGLISLLIVIYLCKDVLFIKRLAHAYGEGEVSYYFLGHPIALSSNSIATYSSISFFCALLKYNSNHNFKYIIFALLLAFSIFLTGSRKGILLLICFYCIYQFIIKENRSFTYKIVALILILFIGYYALLKIPSLKNIIGDRLNSLLLKLFTNETTTEGSISARTRYAFYAREVIKNNSFYGNGLGWFKYTFGNVTENNYYELMVGCGILGLIANYSFVPNALINIIKFNKDKICLSFGLILFVLLVIQLGSVVYLSKDILIYESLLYIFINIKRKDTENTDSFKKSMK